MPKEAVMPLFLILEQYEQGFLGQWRVRSLLRCRNHDEPLGTHTISDINLAEVRPFLTWYIEEYATGASFDRARALRAEREIRTLGVKLQTCLHVAWQAIEAKPELNKELSNGFDVTLCVKGDGTIQSLHALPWELLESPLLWVKSLRVRHVIRCTPSPPKCLESGTKSFKILVLTSRPAKAEDITYRIVSKHIWELSQRAVLTEVDLVFVRPGTWAALIKTLKHYGPGCFNIVHFDTHGSILNSSGQSVLHFNSTELKRTTPISKPATDIASLLAQYRVPSVVLNACLSGTAASSNQNGNLAYSLIQAGIQNVVAMAYRSKVDTATAFVKSFYESLLICRASIHDSVQRGRQILREQPVREARFGESVRCDDWFSVVHYSTALDVVSPGPDAVDPGSPNMKHTNKQRYATPEPDFILASSDADLLALEACLSQSPIVMFCGRPGSGKTHLMADACDWWQKSTFAATVMLQLGDNLNLDQFAMRLNRIRMTAKASQGSANNPDCRTCFVIDSWDSITINPATRHEAFQIIANLFDELDETDSPVKIIFLTQLPVQTLSRELAVPYHEKTSLFPDEARQAMRTILSNRNVEIVEPMRLECLGNLIEQAERNWHSMHQLADLVKQHGTEVLEHLNSITPGDSKLNTESLHVGMAQGQCNGLTIFENYMLKLVEAKSPVYFLILSLGNFQDRFPIQDELLWLFQLYALPFTNLLKCCGLTDPQELEVTTVPHLLPADDWYATDECRVLAGHWTATKEVLLTLGLMREHNPRLDFETTAYLLLHPHLPSMIRSHIERNFADSFLKIHSVQHVALFRFYEKRTYKLTRTYISGERAAISMDTYLAAKCEEKNICAAAQFALNWSGFPFALSIIRLSIQIFVSAFPQRQRNMAWRKYLSDLQNRYAKLVDENQWSFFDDQGIEYEDFKHGFINGFYEMITFRVKTLLDLDAGHEADECLPQAEAVVQGLLSKCKLPASLFVSKQVFELARAKCLVSRRGLTSQESQRIGELLSIVPNEPLPAHNLRIQHGQAMLVLELLEDPNLVNFEDICSQVVSALKHPTNIVGEIMQAAGMTDEFALGIETWDYVFRQAASDCKVPAIQALIHKDDLSDLQIFQRIRKIANTRKFDLFHKATTDQFRLLTASHTLDSQVVEHTTDAMDTDMEDLLEQYEESLYQHDTSLQYDILDKLMKAAHLRRDVDQMLRFEIILEELEHTEDIAPGQIQRLSSGKIIERKQLVGQDVLQETPSKDPAEKLSYLATAIDLVQSIDSGVQDTGGTVLHKQLALLYNLWNERGKANVSCREPDYTDVKRSMREAYAVLWRRIAMHCHQQLPPVDSGAMADDVVTAIQRAFRASTETLPPSAAQSPDAVKILAFQSIDREQFCDTLAEQTQRTVEQCKAIIARLAEGLENAADAPHPHVQDLKQEAMRVLVLPDDQVGSLRFWNREGPTVWKVGSLPSP
ncbi:MAG: hypothetical protein Q9159_002362 [Coniocarpon cinnabarinum]